MSIASTTNRVQYSITGASSSPLTIPFRYDEPGWLMVFYVAENSQEAVTLVNGSDFSLSGDGEDVEGLLTLDAGFLSGVTGGALTISRFTPALQDLNLEYNNRLPAELLERALDRATMEIQDRDVNPGGLGSRAVMFPLTEPGGNPNVLDIPQNRIAKLWGGGVNGSMTFYDAQQVSALILGYLGGPPTTQDYLSAISSVAALRLTAPPDAASFGKFGQLALLPGNQAAMKVTGMNLLNPLLPEEALVFEDGEGFPGTFRYFSYDSVRDQTYEFLYIGLGLNAWRFNAVQYPGETTILTRDAETGFYDTPDLATWADITVEGIANSPERLWISQVDSEFTGTSDWREIVTQSYFRNLSETDPEVLGQLFRTGTALQVSQG